jgi:beta-barrel assembly-enhancing protease
MTSTIASSWNAGGRGTWTGRDDTCLTGYGRKQTFCHNPGPHMKPHRWFLAFLLVLLLSGFPSRAQEDQTAGTQIPKANKSKHLAEKDDVQAIGTRTFGKKGFGNWYSIEEEIGMGREYSKEVDARTKRLRDPIVLEYVNRVGQNLVRNSDAKVPFTIKVIDSDEVNAFALPGGFLYVNSGLILAAENEAELAGVMAHEISHVAARHATRQMTRAQLFNLASIPLIFVGGGIGLAVQEAAGLVIPLSMTKFSRGFEAEADYLGVEYLYKAGYDPQAFISFFERVQALEKQKPGFITKAFSNHPQTPDRVRKTQAEIAKILPPREAYVISTSEFDDVKSRLSMIANRRRATWHGSDHPTLRRRMPADESDSKSDDGPPILRRPGDQ